MNGSDTFKICIDDSEHNTFFDNVVMADIFRKIFNDTTIELDEGKVDQEGVEQIRKNIISFLNQHLKHSEIYSQS